MLVRNSRWPSQTPVIPPSMASVVRSSPNKSFSNSQGYPSQMRTTGSLPKLLTGVSSVSVNCANYPNANPATTAQ